MLQVLNPGQSPPVYDDVPEFWKPPFNRYFPIPEGFPFAGAYMYVTFLNQEPWKKLAGGGPTQEEILLGGPPKDGFIDTHGGIPGTSRARGQWADSHKWFKSAGLPEEIASDEQMVLRYVASNEAAAQWKLTGGKPYVGRFGPMVRFPGSLIWDFEIPLDTWLRSVDNALSTYQMVVVFGLRQAPENWHPWVPDDVRGLVGG